MMEDVWKDNLSDKFMWGGSLACPEEIAEAIDLFVSCEIDPQRFAANCVALFKEDGVVSQEVLEEAARLPRTPSIGILAPQSKPQPKLPIWFMAGFPDVVVWFQRKIMATEGQYTEITALCMDRSHSVARFCRSLVEKYQAETKEPLETAFPNELNLYTGQAMLQAMGEESNYTLIAGMTTKYYILLKKGYQYRFSDETSLLAAAGIVDAQNYIFLHRNVRVDQIIALAKETEKSEDRLYDFVFRQTALLLSVDCPEYTYDKVRGWCEGQADAIRRSVQRTLVSFTGDPLLAKVVETFMMDPRFSELRSAVGVRPG